MNQKQAKEQAETPVKPNYLVIEFSYKTIIVPHKEGVMILEALSKAEIYENSYQKDSLVKPLKTEDITFKFVSDEEYHEAKLRNYLKNDEEEAA